MCTINSSRFYVVYCNPNLSNFPEVLCRFTRFSNVVHCATSALDPTARATKMCFVHVILHLPHTVNHCYSPPPQTVLFR